MDNNVDKTERLKVGFLIGTNLMVGAGVEKVVEELIMNAPDFVETRLIQTDFYDGVRMSHETYNRIKERCKILTLELPLDNWNFMRANKLIAIPYNLFITKLFLMLYLRREMRKFADFVGDLDVVYLSVNAWAVLFKKFDFLKIGSQHVDFMEIRKGKTANLKKKLMILNFFYRNIDGFHLFPYYGSYRDLIKSEYNFVLPARGFDGSLFYPRPVSGKPKFLFVARLEECKGINFALEVWIKAKLNAELHIVGGGTQSDVVKQVADQEENIFYHGILSKQELAEIYGKCDIFLAPTICDSYPSVILEAYISGAYVMMDDYLNGIHDKIVSDGDGEYIKRDHSLWTNSFKSALGRIGEIRASRHIRYERGLAQFETHHITEQFYNEIARLVQKHKANNFERE